MVSEKVVVILIIVAILLSIVSVAVTVSSVNNVKLVPPKVNINKVPSGPDSEKAEVAITISPSP